MRGRKPAIDPDQIIKAVLHFKDRVIVQTDDGQKSKFFKYFILLYCYLYYFHG